MKRYCDFEVIYEKEGLRKGLIYVIDFGIKTKSKKWNSAICFRHNGKIQKLTKSDRYTPPFFTSFSSIK